MKRCPQCNFLYLESDQFCDLDKTLLIADDFGADPGVIKPSEQNSGKPSPIAAVHHRKLNLKTLAAAIVASLIISLMLLLSYQRMRPTQANQAPLNSQAQTSRVSQVSEQVSHEIPASAALARRESGSSVASDNNTSSSANLSSSTTAKTTPNIRPGSAGLRVSPNPVSTGNVTKTNRGPVTIRLADGSSLQADEVWRTKAGIWYRRKGIVTLLKPNRVRAVNN